MRFLVDPILEGPVDFGMPALVTVAKRQLENLGVSPGCKHSCSYTLLCANSPVCMHSCLHTLLFAYTPVRRHSCWVQTTCTAPDVVLYRCRALAM